jgi:hypothetical protein
MCAVFLGTISCMRALLDAGADATVLTDDTGGVNGACSALDFAVQQAAPLPFVEVSAMECFSSLCSLSHCNFRVLFRSHSTIS